MIIQPLTRAHDRAAFDCGEPTLDRFLRETARQDADRDLGVTFVLLADPADPRILGFYTLAMSEVAPGTVPQKGLPSGRTVPVVLLGRLAVDRSRQGQGLGERLLFDALRRAQEAGAQVGSFAVVVDALHDAARQFYLRYGFKSLLDDPLHLYLPMKEIRKMGLVPALPE